MIVTGKDLIAMGYEPDKWFGDAIEWSEDNDPTEEELRKFISEIIPPPALPLHDEPKYFHVNLQPIGDDEVDNYCKVIKTMSEVMRTPTVVEGAIMPDACPAGPVGTIPVGGVVAAKNAIHPGMHSADICCSLMATSFIDVRPEEVMDIAHDITHFGPGGRDKDDLMYMHKDDVERFEQNKFTKGLRKEVTHFLGTQGDGNHFLFVGYSENTDQTFLITHHGSRALGAAVYKRGMKVAERYRKELSPDTLKQNAWIPFDTDDGKEYWEALQLVREWTEYNHTSIHANISNRVGLDVGATFWNEHNFVFKEGDIFYHAKGATPLEDKYVKDSFKGYRIIPLNMAEPILIVKGGDTGENLGFAPHGAGRNVSRSQHKRSLSHKSDEDIFKEETKGLDIRFYSGNTDISELPSAYKNAKEVERQIKEFGLGEIVDRIHPYGSIMAGDWKKDAPWRKKKK